jgi:undecaprenyl-diphosphatase
VPVLGVLLVAALVPAIALWAAVRRWPVADPADPRVGDIAWRRTLRARLDPGAATGLALTLAVAVVIAGGVAVGLLLAMVRRERGLARFDRDVAEWGADQATELTTDVLTLVTHLGSTPVMAVLAAIVIGTVRRPRPPAVAFLVLIIAGQSLITNTIKWSVDRARPDIDPLVSFSSTSFPSGHAAGAAAAYAAMALVLGRGQPLATKAWLAGAAAGVAVAVAATRVLLGVHWLTDALAGLALGWAWFALCAIAFGGRRLRFGAPAQAL